MPAAGRPVGMALPAGSVFKAGNAVLFDLDDTLADRDLARDRFFAFLLNTYFPDLKPDGAESLLRCLQARKHPMAVVTNGSKSQRDKIEALGASRYFEVVLVSEELGIAKPDPRIFRQALSRLNAAPDRSVFVGDSMEHDIAGARNAGMMTVYIRKGKAEDADDALCDLVVADLRELSDLVIGFDAIN